MNYKKLNTIIGWVVFAIAMTVYFFSAERTGSLWDCGEFITGAYKLQVVHPPGAPLFIIIGRMFVWVAEIFTDTQAHPENIAFAVNLLSSVCTAFAAMFACWVATILGKIALVGRDQEPTQGETIAILGAGLVAGLTSAFCTSVWFSAVEGEVYAMSTFFTMLTLWAMIKWYSLPDKPEYDRWIIFAVFASGLSIGVHLLSLLTFPALAMFYYFKKKPSTKSTLFAALGVIGFLFVYSLLGNEDIPSSISFILRIAILAGAAIYGMISSAKSKTATSPYGAQPEKQVTVVGTICSAIIGVGCIVLIQELIITGIPKVWKGFELMMVNEFGAGFQSGIYPLLLLLAGILGGGTYLAHKNKNALLQKLMITATLLVAAYSTIGIVVIRANANTPINMNAPSDPMRLLPYINREQYGERPLLFGPHYMTSVIDVESEQRYGQVTKANGDESYEIVDEKNSYKFDPKTNMFFPRMGHNDDVRKRLYEQWMGKKGPPSQADNFNFFMRYQIKWMYWRYFMWNFSGRQNGEQGFYDWDPKSGNWLTGFDFLDNNRLYNQEKIPDSIKNHEARNKYYMLPFLFGLIGLVFHFMSRPKDMIGLLALFIITGLGIIVYSNQPPNEPRERDYVLVGSFIIYSIWIGMAVLGLFQVGRRIIGAKVAAPLATLLVLVAPFLMGTQNFDDHSRKDHSGARDYASNFLESCAPNAIVFTYGDNDTYPLWYAQETEGIRTDVRVVNLSLIAVDWYIDQLRRKVNESPAINMTITPEAYRGKQRIQVPINPRQNPNPRSLISSIKHVGESHPLPLQSGKQLDSYLPANKLYIDVNRQAAINSGMISASDTTVADRVNFTIPKSKGQWLLKGDVAVMDIIASNAFTRPIYFAVTCRPESMLGLNDYMQLEGLALRFTPVKSAQDRVYGMVGYGRVNEDAVFENIMNKFKWGGFDKHDTFIDRSYGPSVQSIRAVVMRTAQQMIKKGDKTRAVELMDKYFASFPEYNFPYDRNILFFARAYRDAGEAEKAKEVVRKVAKETDQQLTFMASLDEEDLMMGFLYDANSFLSARDEMTLIASQLKDQALQDELTAMMQKHEAFKQKFETLIRSEQGAPSGPFRD